MPSRRINFHLRPTSVFSKILISLPPSCRLPFFLSSVPKKVEDIIKYLTPSVSESSPGGGEDGGRGGPVVGEVADASSADSHRPVAADSISPQATTGLGCSCSCFCRSSGCCRTPSGDEWSSAVGNVRSSVPSPLISFSGLSLVCWPLLPYAKRGNKQRRFGLAQHNN